MAESYSVTAILSAVDKNFTSSMQSAENSVQGVGDGAKSSLSSIMKIASGIGVFKALSFAANTVNAHLDSAIDRYDTMTQFPKIMEQMGFSADDSSKAIDKLSNGIQSVPTSLDSVVSTSKRIALLTGNLDKATDTTLALNNAMISSGSSTADAERGMTQYIQMLSKGKVDAQSWMTLQETMSYALGETAKELGIASGNSQELYGALQSGTISFDEFNDALIECSTRTGGFAEVAANSSAGIKTAMSNMGIYVTRGIANIIGAVDELGKKNGFGGIVENINKLSNGIITVSDVIVSSISGIKSVEGISSLIQSIVPKAIGMISTLVEGMLDRVGSFVDVGISLLEGLANGIVNSIPVVVDKAPKIISKIASAIITNAPKIASSGIQIIVKLAAALVSAIPQLVAKIPSIIRAINSAFRSVNWGQIGRDIISGIANGLKASASSILTLMKNLAKSCLNTVKDFLGIGSPSRVFKKEVGKWIPIGMANGVKAYTRAAVKSVTRMADEVASCIDGDLVGGGRYAIASSYTLSSDYDSMFSAMSDALDQKKQTYTINVTSQIDGKTIAHETATYTSDELEQLERFEELMKGNK